jgi:hypothetical protein
VTARPRRTGARKRAGSSRRVRPAILARMETVESSRASLARQGRSAADSNRDVADHRRAVRFCVRASACPPSGRRRRFERRCAVAARKNLLFYNDDWDAFTHPQEVAVEQLWMLSMEPARSLASSFDRFEARSGGRASSCLKAAAGTNARERQTQLHGSGGSVGRCEKRTGSRRHGSKRNRFECARLLARRGRRRRNWHRAGSSAVQVGGDSLTLARGVDSR